MNSVRANCLRFRQGFASPDLYDLNRRVFEDAKLNVKNFDANSTYVGFPEFCCIARFDVLKEAMAYRRISSPIKADKIFYNQCIIIFADAIWQC